MNKTRGIAAALFLSAALAQAGAPSVVKDERLPYVGTVKAFDAAAKMLTIEGPNGDEMRLKVPTPFLLRPNEAPVPIEQLGKQIGKPVAAYLRDLETIHLVSLIDVTEEPAAGYLVKIFEDDQLLAFRIQGGYQLRLRPSVNLGATDKVGGKRAAASWDWFRERLSKPLAVRSFYFAGSQFIWSVDGWNPDEGEKTATR